MTGDISVLVNNAEPVTEEIKGLTVRDLARCRITVLDEPVTIAEYGRESCIVSFGRAYSSQFQSDTPAHEILSKLKDVAPYFDPVSKVLVF